jgi:hypothetical protein
MFSNQSLCLPEVSITLYFSLNSEEIAGSQWAENKQSASLFNVQDTFEIITPESNASVRTSNGAIHSECFGFVNMPVMAVFKVAISV